MNIKVGITHGDPNGIGYEVVLKALSDKRMLELCTPILYGSKSALDHNLKSNENTNVKFHFIEQAEEAKQKSANFMNCISEDLKVNFGEANSAAGTAAFKALQAAVQDLKNKKIDVLVTAPINKDSIQSDDFKFPGHTEYLAAEDEKEESLMFMVSDKLKVSVVTGHIPLNEISSAITTESILNKIISMENSLKLDFSIRKPKIAVLGLNPHAGDNGLLGKEDQEIILPAIEQAQKKGLLVYGPFSADGFFGSGTYAKFDGVTAMYHDQGLIPFKTIAFGQGTNFTAGLSFVRTSPDHGTGFDIAGQNKADESSLRQAIYAGVDIFKNRSMNNELKSNQLKVTPARKKHFKPK